MKFIDLRSDTVTQPTEAMRKAMFEAEVGDDVYGDDPTVNQLEELSAKITGKEAALFVPSGTFGNQLALFTHCQRGNEVILGEDCHIIMHEVGASSVIAGVQLRPVRTDKGQLDPKETESKIRGVDIHFPETGLICVENAYSNGRVIPLENMKEIYNIANAHNIPVHLDGARLFNAATYLNVQAYEITKYCDSVMFALSKGLCAPVGSVLAGSKEFIDKARKKRKLMGGGLRQAGILASAGLVALNDMIENLKQDHENALYLGKELSTIPGVKVRLDDIHISMVFFTIDTALDDSIIVNEMLQRGIKINPTEDGEWRFVVHYWISRDNVDYIVNSLKSILS
ncbi:low-specificity L-threonine aldolase [Clostridium sp. MSJ-11]|uniref:Low-specificity L-threonine aldolase n=1 Tax=Clostridium mobile TaxID=2841512 RepID=A0ABS6EI78_9CLOT|nr:low-specificity L-threonine aldolase [Clostridium mobile]MBU5484922.1 low-specificity L-threonine aldolase [Clostridium mobile]